MDDELLVREFQRTGDQAHFRALVERHRGPVFRLILSLLGLGHRDTAEELTQDVFLKVYRKLAQFRGDARFSSWIYRIAYNEATRHRSLMRFRTPHEGDDALALTHTDRREDDPFVASADARTTAVVNECLMQLPDIYRAVLHQYYWMGMSVPEIGETLSAPTGTIKSYLHRARAKLQALLAAKGVSHV